MKHSVRGKLTLLILLFLISAFFASCKKTQDEPYWSWEYPETAQFTSGYQDIYGYPDRAEQDYDNLIAYMEQDVYPTDIDIIVGYIRDTNPGKSFFNWQYALVEKLENGEWVQLNYKNENILRSFGWGYATYDPPRSELQYETKKKYWLKYVVGGVTPGEYRMVIFAGTRILYAPFRFVTPEEYHSLYPEEYQTS